MKDSCPKSIWMQAKASGGQLCVTCHVKCIKCVLHRETLSGASISRSKAKECELYTSEKQKYGEMATVK